MLCRLQQSLERGRARGSKEKRRKNGRRNPRTDLCERRPCPAAAVGKHAIHVTHLLVTVLNLCNSVMMAALWRQLSSASDIQNSASSLRHWCPTIIQSSSDATHADAWVASVSLQRFLNDPAAGQLWLISRSFCASSRSSCIYYAQRMTSVEAADVVWIMLRFRSAIISFLIYCYCY